MISELYQREAGAKQLFLDPRTKILLCLSVSTTLIAGSGGGYLLYLRYALSVLPLIFLLILKKYHMAIYYVSIYAFALFVPSLIMPYLPTTINFLFTGVFAFSTKLIPGTMMAYFLFATTSVGEFMAAMDRMHVTKKLSVPISTMFRFFPTILEEYRNVQDAMKLRGVGSLRDPMKMLEYRMVPFLMSVVAIGNDLSASALTRGLNSPVHRTNVCNIRFTKKDVIAVVSMVIFFCAYFGIMLWQGGIL